MKIIQISSKRIPKTAQDNGGFYSGDQNLYDTSYIGSPNVNIAELVFEDSQKAVDLVNRFDASLLQNIVYMFDFNRAGVYGVYLPSLDRDQKTQELTRELEQIGYKIVDEDGIMSAYPVNGYKDDDTIKQEIKQIYDKLEQKGGSVLGINSNETRKSVLKQLEEFAPYVPEKRQAELENDLMIAFMAGTMAHEATHAHGATDEGGPEQADKALLNGALAEIKTKFDIKEKDVVIQDQPQEPMAFPDQQEVPLAAESTNWYKTATYDSYKPLYGPTGSDLTGRFGTWTGRSEGQADFGMIAQQNQNKAIEEMLGRHFMSPLPDDLSLEHDILESQLRKYTREDFHLDPTMIFEELLRDGRVNDGSEYKTLEELLEDKRPQPLMVPIRTASMTKLATLFGWNNNLEISDGSTIGGMGDRAMLWKDRDESFSEEESWIKSQPRYNPEYDTKGFYYRWMEPRFKPELWDSYTRDYSNTSPARRFASEDDLTCVVHILEKVRNSILSKELNSARFIGTEEIGIIIDKVMTHSKIKFDVFYLGEQDGEEICSYWVYHASVKSKNVELAEKQIQNGDIPDEMESLLGCKSTLGSSVEEVMEAVREVCKEYRIKGIYAIGAYAREKSFGEHFPEVHEIDFSSDDPTQNLKVGYLVAKHLGVDDVKFKKSDKSVTLIYKGVKISFSGGNQPETISRLMMEKGIDSSSNILSDACNKDFTVNMKAYNPIDGFVYPLFGGDDNTIRTLFDSDTMLQMNPFIILRALHLVLAHGCSLDQDLENAIKKNAFLVFDGRLSDDNLLFAKHQILNSNPETAQDILNQYGLSKILEIGD